MSGLLDGVRVLDFTQVIAGPACTRLMAELGAEVIKVELAPLGDYARGMPLMRDGRSAYFFQHNQGKLSLCLDLGRPRAREHARKLLRAADTCTRTHAHRTCTDVPHANRSVHLCLLCRFHGGCSAEDPSGESGNGPNELLRAIYILGMVPTRLKSKEELHARRLAYELDTFWPPDGKRKLPNSHVLHACSETT